MRKDSDMLRLLEFCCILSLSYTFYADNYVIQVNENLKENSFSIKELREYRILDDKI